MTNDKAVRSVAEFFGVMSEPTRLRIVCELARGERNVSQLIKAIKLPQATVSHHLSLLRAHRIVENERRGKEVFYTLSRMAEVDSKRVSFIIDDETVAFSY